MSEFEAEVSPKECFESDWEGPVIFTDLSPLCYMAHQLEVCTDRPCIRFENVLTKKECDNILSMIERNHSECDSLIPGVRSQFSVDDVELSDLIWSRIKDFIPSTLDGGNVLGLQTNWRHGLYIDGQSVFAHMDFRHYSKEDENVASRLSFTLYLNEEFENGETAFVLGPLGLDGSHGPIFYKSKPKTGSAILFYQCVPEYMHTAEVVRNGKKYIMRADVMYRFFDKAAARSE